MFKRLGYMLALLAFVGLVGCSSQSPKSTDANQPSTQVAGFKIGLMTGTVSQNEEEFRASPAGL